MAQFYGRERTNWMRVLVVLLVVTIVAIVLYSALVQLGFLQPSFSFPDFPS